MNDLTFELRDKLPFANLELGADDETMEISLRAPNYEGSRQPYFRMYRHLSAAILALSRDEASKKRPRESRNDDQDMDGETAIMIISAYSDDFSQVIEDFTDLALRVGFLNDKTPLLEKHLGLIGPNEIIRMCGEYVAFFIAPSLLSQNAKTGSKR